METEKQYRIKIYRINVNSRREQVEDFHEWATKDEVERDIADIFSQHKHVEVVIFKLKSYRDDFGISHTVWREDEKRQYQDPLDKAQRARDFLADQVERDERHLNEYKERLARAEAEVERLQAPGNASREEHERMKAQVTS